VRLRVDLDDAPEDVRIAAVAAVPEIVADDDDRLAALAIVGVRERAPDLRHRADQAEHVRIHRGAGVAIRVARAVADRRLPVLHPRDRAERFRPLLPVELIQPR
jgi:hypothetical protein